MAPAQASRLLPSLFALLPSSQLELMLSRLSLMAIHVESHTTRDDIYHTTHSVIAHDVRPLRLRSRRRRPRPTATITGRWPGNIYEDETGAAWEYSLAWVSNRLSGSEYSSMRVQAQVELDVAGLSTREEIDDFIVAMGHKHSHGYTRVGQLFHLPVAGWPNWTLHLTISRVLTGDEKPENSSEPYLVQLCPARLVNSLPSKGEPSPQDMMLIIKEMSEKIDGLKWESGR